MQTPLYSCAELNSINFDLRATGDSDGLQYVELNLGSPFDEKVCVLKSSRNAVASFRRNRWQYLAMEIQSQSCFYRESFFPDKLELPSRSSAVFNTSAGFDAWVERRLKRGIKTEVDRSENAGPYSLRNLLKGKFQESTFL